MARYPNHDGLSFLLEIAIDAHDEQWPEEVCEILRNLARGSFPQHHTGGLTTEIPIHDKHGTQVGYVGLTRMEVELR